MANILNCQLLLNGQVSIANSDNPISPQSALARLGQTLQAPQTLLDGTTGPAIADTFYSSQQAVAAGGHVDLDLNGGTMSDALNVPMTWSKLYLLLVQIVAASPDGTRTVLVGPQGQANALDIGLGGVAAANSVAVMDWLKLSNNSLAGWPVSAGAKVVRISNPGAAAVTVQILAIGKK